LATSSNDWENWNEFRPIYRESIYCAGKITLGEKNGIKFSERETNWLLK
jgi:hypothetical protein